MHKVCYLDQNWLAHKMNNELLKGHLSNMKGVVYDLGCGTRPYEKEILAVADRYIGVDWSNTLHGLHADIVADLNKPLPIDSNVAENVISLQVMEHLCEPQTMLGEAFRILKNGGFVYITVPFQWWVHEAPYDYFRYTRHGLEYMLAKAGFVDIVVEESTGFWAMWFLKLNYQTARLVRGPKPLRWLVKACFLPLWLVDQFIAPVMDRYWPAPQETTGYSVTARKP
ncbi:MAG: class I SAM-dependent methyltransferase [Proteobacteria bacterium]|nr:class I SAM-dependent methyltransferase [Sideroxydans sp.]MBU4154374.1 class I SAM-dependent methyltransferase [Pseudomonadota bacterium]